MVLIISSEFEDYSGMPKRNLTLTMKPEMDLLLRLSLTNQISLALNHAGLNTNHPLIIIIYSTNKRKVYVRKRNMKTFPNLDNSVIKIDKESRDHIFRLILANKRNQLSHRDDKFITKYLIERSALVIK